MIIDSYLLYLNEKLEDIPSTINKKWYDILNIKLRKALQKEINEIFQKNFKLNHPLLADNKTKIVVSLPLLGYTYHIDINLYDKKGNDIIDYKHKNNYLEHPLNIQINKHKNNKWELYYHTLFILPEYQKKNISKYVIKSINKCIKILQNTREVYLQGTDVGRYMISRIKGCKFKKDSFYGKKKVDKHYDKWCYLHNVPFKNLKNPKDYPKEFLLSRYAPQFIDYMIPL